VAAKRSWRALSRILETAAADNVEDVASQSSDLAVVVRALEQPEAIETLKQEDLFAAADVVQPPWGHFRADQGCPALSFQS
jgi:hypothetical protein